MSVIRFSQRGAMSLLLAFSTVGATMGTVYYVQNVMGGFLNQVERGSTENEIHDTARELLDLSSYLVFNNLILCRAQGWGGTGSLCRWWSDVVPEGSVILRQNQSECKRAKDTLCGCKKLKNNKIEGVKCRKEDFFKISSSSPSLQGRRRFPLTFKNKMISFSGREEVVQYEISFDLIKMDDVRMNTLLLSEIPYRKQRRTRIMTIPLKSSAPLNPVQTLNEMNSPFDEDTFYVIITVKLFSTTEVQSSRRVASTNGALSSREGTTQVMKEVSEGGFETQYTGVMRRPLSMITLDAQDQVKCTTHYNAQNTANIYPSFRGHYEAQKSKAVPLSSLRVKVTNHGPGAIYSPLSFFRKQSNNDVGLTKDFLTHYDRWYSEQEVLKKPQNVYTSPKPKRVFLPGESIEYVDEFSSEICKNKAFVQARISTQRLSYYLWNLYGWNTNNHDEPPRSSTGLGTFGMGLCLNAGTLVMSPVSTPPLLLNPVSRPILCSYKYRKQSEAYCKSVLPQASCRYVLVEPRRVFKPISFLMKKAPLSPKKKGKGLGAFHVNIDKSLSGFNFAY